MTERLPNLVIAGFPKCATTSVAATLAAHPDVCGAFPHHGTNFFTPLLYDPQTTLSPDGYAQHYARCRGEAIRVDHNAVAAYGGARVAAAVRAVLGEPKVLIMLREPVARTASYLVWKKRHGELPAELTLREYVRRCSELGPRTVDTASLNPFSGLFGSDYPRFLPAWVDAFGPELRVGFVDDLAADAVGFYRAIAGWLGVDTAAFTADVVRVENTARSARSPRAERVIRRVGRRVQPLARRAPRLYRGLRDGARWANMTAPVPVADDAEARESLREFFAPGLAPLAETVRGHELVHLPAWLTTTSS